MPICLLEIWPVDDGQRERSMTGEERVPDYPKQDHFRLNVSGVLVPGI